ncbi:uncharacterized protein FA14DRAFT_54065 [Meira miltonrushii]|uniref:Uncharacterized protein n=1 Tax=Meira miltonrushii TaxID=1280837 RepID=A0A316VL98_9BASI|nr:uncharacterized protein FA14DRAFT_54065 [Meira miltonrushii]PWN36315.1 hypothetical protein FA14DRAFT_54065 [Meira miltonrushii]
MSESSTIDISATSQEQACAVISSAIHHLLFAKGQIHQPIAVLRKQRDQGGDNVAFCDEDEQDRSKSKTKKISFTAQRKERRLNEMIANVDRLHDQLVRAVEAVTDSGNASSGDEVVLMLRLGQSPLTMARQQFKIQLNGLLSLPRTAIEADKHNPPKPSIARQVFGGKMKKSVEPTASQSSMSRVPVLERKLVRFFLSANMDESGLGKALTAPIAPTRSQIFIQAPRIGFAAKGWIPRPSLKVAAKNDGLDGVRTHATHKQERSEEGSGSNETVGTTAEDVDMLALGLSPVKRRALMSPKVNPAKKVKPLIFRQDSDLDHEHTEQAKPLTELQNERTSPLKPMTTNVDAFTESTTTDQPALTAQELMDQKRMARMRSRPTEGQHKKTMNPKADIGKHPQTKPIRKQRMISASIIINFTSSGPEKHDNFSPHDRSDNIWYASDIVLQACTL